MKKSTPIISMGASLLLMLLPTASFGQAPTRIMPVGDSITNGTVPGGYRDRLYSVLTTAGYNVDFVGSVTTNPSGTLPDSDHDGHGGWRIDQIDSNIEGWFNIIKDPDVILLHIGTNDFGQNNDTPNAINRLDALITKTALARPYAHIIVTNIMERGEPQNTAIQTEFNPFVEATVNAQAGLGRRVTFLDMRAAVPLSDMPDNLHPNQTGYDKMADAWLPAIQSVIGVDGDGFAPELARAEGAPDYAHVDITFSKPVADTAATPGFYSIDGGLTVSAVTLDADKRIVTLTTSAQTPGTSYTVTVNGVVDRTTGPLALAANSTIDFNASTLPGYENNVPESDCYTLVYSLNIPNAANYSLGAVPSSPTDVPYDIDIHSNVGTYDRVAYYMELQEPGGNLQYAWASMDAFDTNAANIGVPSLATGVTFQQSVSNLNVVSNVSGVTTGEGQTGNLEFWPTNYNVANDASVPGASGALFDLGDIITPGNYGSMQVHNTSATQTVIAFNKWGGSVGNACVGIGNNPGTHPDWTFEENAADYTVKKIQVLVRTTGDLTPPTLASAQAGFDDQSITVTFSEPIRPDTLLPANFTLDNGVSVLSVETGDDLGTVRLLTTTHPGVALTLTVSNLRDTSQNANPIAPASTIAVTAAALPAEVIANVGAPSNGYELVYSLDIGVTGDFNSPNPYTIDNSAKPGPFSRVAYYLELQSGGITNYVWTSMDAFTQEKSKIGVPTVGSGAFFQTLVTDLDIISNKAGVTTGTGLATGNIEFWPGNYNGTNPLSIPNASGSAFDFGDGNAGTTAGHGSMQVHNHGASQTLFSMTNFGVDGRTLGIGIGNDPTPTNGGVDWTFAANAGTEYSKRTLHVMVLPAPYPTTLPAEVTTNIGAAADDYELIYSIDLPATGNFNVPTGPAYTVNNSSMPGSFSRVAYYLELDDGVTTEYVWTSMDAFTDDRTKIGIPTVASGARFQTLVSNLDVFSNSSGVTTGTGIATGNIEFWPNSYDRINSANIPGASGSLFDVGDRFTSSPGYGSMQVHNHGASETLFAMNHFGTDGAPLCLGIGNDPNTANGTDWTFEDNAGAYTTRTLHVMVLPSTFPTEIAANVPESTDYELVYSLDIPSNGNLAGPGTGFTDYSLNNSASETAFSRVAYYLELQKTGDSQPTYVWASMDAFTQDRSQIGVPTVASGALWQQYVTNMNVVSNSGNVTNGTGFTGNLEFWPGNYGRDNDLSIPGASDSFFDIGDGSPGTGFGHGSMQVHNPDSGETLFAINRWGANNNTGNALAVGIGNENPLGTGDTDYTFAANAPTYDLVKRLHVLVLPAPDAPVIVDAMGSATLERLTVTFDRELTDNSAVPGNFSIDGGLTVTGATLLPGNTEMALTTSPQTSGTLYTVSVSGVQDRTGGSPILPGASVQFTSYTADAILANVPDTGMELIYQLEIPAAKPRWNVNPITYSIDEAKYGEVLFDRVAYLMELDGDWAYVSFDPQTNQIAQTGVPSLQVTSTPFQQIVTDMNVASNVAGIVTGNGITTGNIEFWGGNYGVANGDGIPNASGTLYDFGDTMTTGSHACMQIHNHDVGASQTIIAYNNWGTNSGGNSDVGIGNRPTSHPDWTNAVNAGDFTARNLYVLVRPGGSAPVAGPDILIHPCDRSVDSGDNVAFSVTVDGGGPHTYQWRFNGAPIGGANAPWLELSAVTSGAAGSYDVVVTGPNLGSSTSETAILDVSSSPIESWRIANGFTTADGSAPGEGDLEDKDLDGLSNLLEFAFGTDPNVPDSASLVADGSINGLPILQHSGGVGGITFDLLFVRRKDFGSPGSVSYTPQFSADLTTFHDSTATPTFVADSTDDPAYEVVKVPYPATLPDGKKAQFSRMKVDEVP